MSTTTKPHAERRTDLGATPSSSTTSPPLDWCHCGRGFYIEDQGRSPRVPGKWCSSCGASPYEGGEYVHFLCRYHFPDADTFYAHLSEGRCVALQELARSEKLPSGTDYQSYLDEAAKAQVRRVGRPSKSLRTRRQAKAAYQRKFRRRGH